MGERRDQISIKMRLLLMVAVMMLSVLQGKAQDGKPERPVQSIFSIDVGGARVLDTYLTPLQYRGTNLRLSYEREQAMRFNPEKWLMQLDAAIDYNNVKNPAKSRTMHHLEIDLKWGMMHRWQNVFTDRLQMAVGGSAQLRGGVIYNAINSNNPVSAKIRVGVNLTGMVSYPVKLGVPMVLRYEATLPVLGVCFSPEYGESFYEIYLGDRRGLVHPAWWGNRFDMENLVTADLRITSGTILRVGYRNRIEISKINNLHTRVFTNSAVLGVGGEWVSAHYGKAVSPSAEKIVRVY